MRRASTSWGCAADKKVNQSDMTESRNFIENILDSGIGCIELAHLFAPQTGLKQIANKLSTVSCH
jgi:hypothetical protein